MQAIILAAGYGNRMRPLTSSTHKTMLEIAGRSVIEASTEMQTLVALLESLRDLLPPELREQVTALARQLLLVLRALIDWLVDRLERGPRGSAPEVEDIPIS